MIVVSDFVSIHVPAKALYTRYSHEAMAVKVGNKKFHPYDVTYLHYFAANKM